MPVEHLLSSLRQEKKAWRDLHLTDLEKIQEESSKQRYEIKDGNIRALYGHSISQKMLKELSRPPEYLYHGTSPEAAESILREGLKPMNRQYVHLSIDTDMAELVGQRKAAKPIMLLIKAEQAFEEGVKFYKGNQHVWLADEVPSEFISSF